MNIALVGKFDGNGWRMESMAQRALWNLGHEVYGIQIVPPPVVPNWADLDPDADELDARAAYQQALESWHGQLSGSTQVDLTIVLQGYGLPAAAIMDVQARTGRPVVCWHAEVMSPDWPTADEVVQAKTAQLVQNAWAYDLVVHNCSCCLQTIEALGASKVAWCPANGVDAEIHYRRDLKKAVDVGIYGWPSQRRLDMVKAVIEQLPEGTTYAWPDPNDAGSYGEGLMTFINRCKLVLNVHYSDTKNTECRLYEALGCGVPVVSEPISMPDLFPSTYGVVYGETTALLAAQIQAVLSLNQSEYLGLADAGYELVHQRYRYEDRCAQLLEIVAKELG